MLSHAQIIGLMNNFCVYVYNNNNNRMLLLWLKKFYLHLSCIICHEYGIICLCLTTSMSVVYYSKTNQKDQYELVINNPDEYK